MMFMGKHEFWRWLVRFTKLIFLLNLSNFEGIYFDWGLFKDTMNPVLAQKPGLSKIYLRIHWL